MERRIKKQATGNRIVVLTSPFLNEGDRPIARGVLPPEAIGNALVTGPRPIGLAAVALGIGFNIPYAVLANLYDYPQILRQPAEAALMRFAEGGPVIVLAWYGFMLAALALIPVALGLSITRERLSRHPALAIGAAISGALAGLAQAIGLSRWVFVIPRLAETPASADSVRMFDTLNAFGGVAIGEHLGQLLTALFIAQIAALQKSEGYNKLAFTAGLTSLAIAIGTGEGLASALGADGSVFSLVTIAGFLGLTVWLIATGWMLARPQRKPVLAAV